MQVRPAKQSAPPLIDYRNVAFTTPSATIVDGFNLALADGDKVVLHGPSGSGKSTLLKLLLGFLEPSRGTIQVSSQPLNSSTVWHLRQRAAYVSQDVPLGQGTGRQFLAEVHQYKANAALSFGEPTIEALCASLLLPVALLDSPLTEVSGGERQRIALLAALLLERQILILDEPTAALDHQASRAVLDLIGRLENTTVLAASHDPQWFNHATFRAVQLEAVNGRT